MARSRRFLAIGGGVVVLLVVAGFAGWWFVIRDDAPEEASIDEASETLGEGSESGGSLEGDWTVDTSIGSFDYDAEDFSGTWAGYRFDEELGSIGANTAVGRTPGVSGTMTVEGDEVTAVDVEVDMTQLVSDEDRRDNAIRERGLQTTRFPTGTFTLTEPLALPDGVESGERVSATATGELTFHGVTRPETLEIEAELRDDRAVVVGRAPVAMADYDIEPPTNAFVLSVAEEGTFEFQIFFSRQ